MSKSTITTDEWLSELARLTTPKDGEGLTALEWGERLGLSTKSALIKLNQAHRKGWVKLGHRHATRLDGKPCFVPVYRVEKPKK